MAICSNTVYNPAVHSDIAYDFRYMWKQHYVVELTLTDVEIFNLWRDVSFKVPNDEDEDAFILRLLVEANNIKNFNT